MKTFGEGAVGDDCRLSAASLLTWAARNKAEDEIGAAEKCVGFLSRRFIFFQWRRREIRNV